MAQTGHNSEDVARKEPAAKESLIRVTLRKTTAIFKKLVVVGGGEVRASEFKNKGKSYSES